MLVVLPGSGAWVDQAKPAANHGDSLVLRVAAGTRYAFVWPASAAPPGTVVSSAVLRLRTAGASTGARTVTVEPVAARWDAGKVTWDTMPGVTGPPSSVTVGDMADNTTLDVDVTAAVSAATAGARFRGWRVSTTGTPGHAFANYGSPSHPRLLVTYDYPPAAATDLTPNGVVSTPKPRLRFTLARGGTAGAVQAVRVQVDPTGNWVSPGWDSGDLPAPAAAEVDLAGTTYPGLGDGASTVWRVGVRGAGGGWVWSTAATFTRVDLPALTLTSPGQAPLDYVSEATPPVVWSFPGQAAYRVQVYDDTSTTTLADSRKTSGAATSWTVPTGVLKVPGRRYRVAVTGWDNRTDRVTGYTTTRAEQEFTFTLDTGVDPVENLTVEQVDGSPLVRLRFTRGTAPDGFAVHVDGTAATEVDPADAADPTGPPGSYTFDHWAASAYRRHTYQVLPVVNRRTAGTGPAATLTTRVAGTWLCDPATGARFCVLDEQLNLTFGEDAEVTPKAGQDFTRKITSMRGLEGEVTGVLVEESNFDPRPLEDQLTDVYTIKGRQPSRLFRFATGDLNIPVVVGNLSPAPGPAFTEHTRQWAVSYWVGQRGELPYTVVL